MNLNSNNDIKGKKMRKKYRLNLLKLAQIMFVTLSAFSLEWALWAELPYTSLLFTLSCMGGFGLMFIYVAPKIQEINWKKVLPEYMYFIVWIALMIIAYEVFYPIHQKNTFLVLTMDSYAIFFIRLLVAVIPFMFFVDLNKFKETKLFKLVLAVVIGTNAFFTFRAVQFYPDAIRARATMEHIGAEEFLFATPDYEIVYGMALIFPVLLQKIKSAQTKMDKIIYLIFTGVVFYIIMVSQFATALLITIVGSLIFIMLSLRKNKRVLIVSVIGFLVFYVHITKMDVEFLNLLADAVDGVWSGKLRDIAVSISGSSLSGSLSERNDLYQESLETFLENPLFGILTNPTGSIGGHATAFDILGLTGIFGFIPFVLTLVYNFRRVCRTCNYPKNKAAIIACNIELIIVIFTKNIISSLSLFFAFFVLLPMLLKMENSEERIS